MAFLFGQSTEQEYRIRARLTGSAGPINCLAFTDQGTLLASGGDDEKLRLWDVERKQSFQVISDDLERWGQITCIKWLSGFSEETLCFGTSRGLVLIYARHSKDSNKFKELSNTAVLPFNEPIEAMDYDQCKCRLALSSHTGKIKIFHVEKNGTLVLSWSKNWNEVREMKGITPRSVRFTGKGDNISIFGLESGMIVSKVAATGNDNWNKILKSSIGNVAFSTDMKWVLIDNLSKGFDLYSYPHTSPSDSFSIPREKAFVHQGVFLGDQTSVACGSDHGKIYIFSLGTSKCLQRLNHGNKRTIVQVLDACSTPTAHLITSGTSEKRPEILIWEKRLKQSQEQTRGGRNFLIVMVLLNLFLVVLFTLLWLNGNRGWNWIDSQYGVVKEEGWHQSLSAQQILEDAEALLQRMDSNDKKWSNHVKIRIH